MAETHDLYKASGVDIDAGEEAVRRIKPHAARTMRPEVLAGLGGFGGGFALPVDRYREPVLVSGTDGVGTKLKVAFALNRHDTIGIDCVAMCVNDILAMGAEPLFFLDYFATGVLMPTVLEQVVRGVADGCQAAGAALIGGETAEMPDVYAKGEYDIAGFAVGVVERDRMIDGRRIEPGDVLIGLASSGLHSNGFSLVRKMIREAGVGWQDCPPQLGGIDVGTVVLTPTRIYVSVVRALLERFDIRGMAHITGGGLLDNVPRMLAAHLGCVIDPESWTPPAVYPWLQSLASVDTKTCYRTWNMGIGFVLAVSNAEVDEVMEALQDLGETAWVIGSVEAGLSGVELAAGSVPR
ncbi:MAG: phosphoribosylformylglycinamidine cyclo-ligase [Firmicutes bacterium]|nr:phosphoribosylformylglycinamidine cyclo-ligase [Bacillota bacterium]